MAALSMCVKKKRDRFEKMRRSPVIHGARKRRFRPEDLFDEPNEGTRWQRRVDCVIPATTWFVEDDYRRGEKVVTWHPTRRTRG